MTLVYVNAAKNIGKNARAAKMAARDSPFYSLVCKRWCARWLRGAFR